MTIVMWDILKFRQVKQQPEATFLTSNNSNNHIKQNMLLVLNLYPWKSKTIKKIVPWNCWLKIPTKQWSFPNGYLFNGLWTPRVYVFVILFGVLGLVKRYFQIGRGVVCRILEFSKLWHFTLRTHKDPPMEGFEPVQLYSRGVLGVLKITIFEGSGFLGHKMFRDSGIFSRWWNLFIFTPNWGRWIHFDKHIFQMGGSTTNRWVDVTRPQVLVSSPSFGWCRELPHLSSPLHLKGNYKPRTQMGPLVLIEVRALFWRVDLQK